MKGGDTVNVFISMFVAPFLVGIAVELFSYWLNHLKKK